MNKWSEQFNVPFPQCNMCGQCCRCASPSSPTEKLLERIENEDEFAKDFFSIFTPYKNLEEARQANSGIVERSLKACEKPDSKVRPEEVVFYCCKYIGEDNKCTIHEDRPNLCREYPDSPFLIFPPGCAYEPWAKECRLRYNELQEELKMLNEYRKQLADLKYQQNAIKLLRLLKMLPEDRKLTVLLPAYNLVSPYKSWIKIY